MTQTTISLFGSLRVEQASRTITSFRTQKTGALLAYLAFYRQHPHSRGALAYLLWPEIDPDAARHKLRVALSSLRRQLDPPDAPGAAIRVSRASVQLHPASVTTDVAEFEAALRSARRSRSSIEREQLFSRAVTLYRGELLPDHFEEWIQPERQRLAETFYQAIGELISLREQAGDLPGALRLAHRLVSDDWLREDFHHELIRLLVAAGDTDGARRQYRELERLLDEHFGVLPAPEMHVLVAGSDRPPRGPHRREGVAREDQRRENSNGREERSPVTPPPVRAPLEEERIDLAAASPPAGTVTFLLAELEALLPGHSETGPPPAEAEEALLALRRELESHSGWLAREAGGSILAAFNRASDAAAAALAVQHGMAFGASVRMALHTGEVEPANGSYSGPAGEHAARVLIAAHPGQALCSESAAALIRSEREPGRSGIPLTGLGSYRLRDETGTAALPERLFQLGGGRSEGLAFPPPKAVTSSAALPMRLTRFFGREAEIGRLVELLGEVHRRDAEDAEDRRDAAGRGSASLALRSPRLCGENAPLSTAGVRLVTLTGPGGAGKTRLALEVAERLSLQVGGAVWFVSLAELTDARLIPARILEGMRLLPSPDGETMAQVIEALSAYSAGTQRTLMVLDNCEHLVPDVCAVVRALLEQAPALTLLATSRQPLGLTGERLFPVGPLPVPEGEGVECRGWGVGCDQADPAAPYTLHPTPYTLLQSPSVQLFVDRVQAVQPDFQVTGRNAAAVGELCRRLEGIPLALELAAARAGVLTLAQMLAQMDRRFGLLVSRKWDVSARHQSLRGAIEWSYRLLSPALQRFFARLAVFHRGWTAAAAEALCEEPNALEYLEQLRSCSLVLAEAGDLQESTAGRQWAADLLLAEGARFQMLETLRDFAGEKLTADERAAMERRHAEHYLALAQDAERASAGSARAEWLGRLVAEQDNLRAALAWAEKSGEIEIGLKLATALYWYWRAHGDLAEGRRYLSTFLALAPTGTSPALRVKSLQAAARLAHRQSDFALAEAHVEAALALSRDTGGQMGVASLLIFLGDLAKDQGQPDRAQAFYQDALSTLRELGDKKATTPALHRLAKWHRDRGQYAEARSLYEESLAIGRELGDRGIVADAFINLGCVARCAGDLTSARRLHEQSLSIHRELGDPASTAASLMQLARTAREQEDDAAARSLYDESLAIYRACGDQPSIALALREIGELAAEQRDHAAALSSWEESLALYQEMGHRGGAACLRGCLGSLVA